MGSECIEWERARSGKGYGVVWVDGKCMLAHRQAFLEANGYLPTVVRHMCDNRACVNPAHLEGGTHKDNTADMFRRGRDRVNRLSQEVVAEVRRALGDGETGTSIAKRLGIGNSTVSRIKLNRRVFEQCE